MLHSDQSFQHTTRLFKDTLKALGATISHSSKESVMGMRVVKISFLN